MVGPSCIALLIRPLFFFFYLFLELELLLNIADIIIALLLFGGYGLCVWPAVNARSLISNIQTDSTQTAAMDGVWAPKAPVYDAFFEVARGDDLNELKKALTPEININALEATGLRVEQHYTWPRSSGL